MNRDVAELRNALAEVAPAAVAVATDWADPAASPQAGGGDKTAHPKRRAEFLCGRDCAGRALLVAGTRRAEVGADADGAPVWPEGFVGSISHSRGMCCAVAASADDVRCVGVDLERTDRIRPAVLRRILLPDEAARVGADLALGTLFFSAKEAFFKAQFPLWRARPAFSDVGLSLSRDLQKLEIVSLATALPPELRGMREAIHFRWGFSAGYVVAVCWIPAHNGRS